MASKDAAQMPLTPSTSSLGRQSSTVAVGPHRIPQFESASVHKLGDTVRKLSTESTYESNPNHLEIRRPTRVDDVPTGAAGDTWQRLRVLSFRMSRGVSIGRQTKRLKSFDNVFTGTDAASWLIADKDNLASCEEEAVSLGQQLLDNGFIRRVSTTVSSYAIRYRRATEKRVFKSGNHFYRFVLESCCPHILYVMVVGARNLKHVDIGSDNDPFVKLHVGPQVKRTSVIMNTPAPIWRDEVHSFGVVDPLAEHLRLSVMDYNEFAPNDHVGDAEISLMGVKSFSDAQSLQEAIRGWRERSEEGIFNSDVNKADPTDIGWINVKMGSKVTGQVRLALMLRDFEAREKERFRNTLQPYKLHCHIFGIEGVQERGVNYDHWVGTNIFNIQYVARVKATCDDVVAKTPWVSKQHTGHAKFAEGGKEEGCALCLDIESNYLTGAVKLVVQQKLPTDQDIVAHSLAAIRVPFDQIPILSDLDKEITDKEEADGSGPPVPVCVFHLMDGARRKYELDVQNGRLVAAIWLEMQANNVVGPWIEESLSFRPYALTTRLSRTALQASMPIGVERLWRAMMRDDAFMMHAVYEEMLYSRVEVQPWVRQKVQGNEYFGFSGTRELLTRAVRFTITGITNLGNCQVEELYYVVDKQKGGFTWHVVSRYFSMPFCDKFRSHVSVIIHQDLTDPYTSHVHVSSEMDFSIDGGPPEDIREELTLSSNASIKTVFITWCNVIKGAVQGSNREKQKHEECFEFLRNTKETKTKVRKTVIVILTALVLFFVCSALLSFSAPRPTLAWDTEKGELGAFTPVDVCLDSGTDCNLETQEEPLGSGNSSGR